MRKKTRQIKVGKVVIGGDALISIQSMCNTLTKDLDGTLNQIHALEEAGCEIVRVSVPDTESVQALKKIKENISIPLVADIHYDYKLALEAAKHADKLRINPGNIGDDEKVKLVVGEVKNRGLSIRIGVNMGSLEKDIEQKFGLTARALVESALKYVRVFEKIGFYDTIVSLKASDVPRTIEAYRMFSKLNDYPLHLGITESGTSFTGGVKSAVGIGTLLAEGIGDTIRVSLSADPVEEVKVGKEILKSLRLRRFGVDVVACPTCARAEFDVAKVASEIEAANSKKIMTIAVMGCGVNGPGEAKEADIGIVGGKEGCLLYKNGEVVGKVRKEEIVDRILGGINNY